MTTTLPTGAPNIHGGQGPDRVTGFDTSSYETNHGLPPPNGSGGPHFSQTQPFVASGVTMSQDELELLMSSAFSKINEMQIKTQELGITTASLRKKELLNEIIKKLENAIHAAQKAKKGGLLKKIFGWITKIFTVIAAAMATALAVLASPFTGGASMALAVMSGVLFASALMDLASMISEASGGPSFESGRMAMKATSEVLQKCGMSKKKADKVASNLVMAMTIVVTVAMLAISFGSSAVSAVNNIMRSVVSNALSAASKARPVVDTAARASTAAPRAANVTNKAMDTAMDTATDTATAASKAASEVGTVAKRPPNLMKIAAQVEGAATVTVGVSQIGGGIASIETAKLELKANKAKFDAATLQVIIDAIEKDLDEHVENIRDLFQFNKDFFSDLSKGMQDASRSRHAAIATMA